MILRKAVFVIITALLGISEVQAQRYNIKTYSVNDGLPSSYVYDVEIDELGIVWFATGNGLVKSDGTSYEVYNADHGLRDALIYDIYKDKDQNFWVSTEFGGVAKFSNDSLIYTQELAHLDSLLINYMLQAPDGGLWFGTNDDGISIWHSDTNSIERIDTTDGLTSNQIWDFYFDEEGIAWISTMNGVTVYDPEARQIVKTYTSENGLGGEYLYQVFEASDGSRWVPHNNGYSVIRKDGSIENVTEIDGEELGYVFNIAEDIDGVIWIGTERNGLYWFDGEDYTHIKKKNGLSSNYVYRLIKDNEGTIWVATDGNGVSIFKDKEFRMFDASSELDANSIYSIRKSSDGTLWLGTENGLSSLKDGNFTNFEIDHELYQDSEIWDIEELPNGNLLLLTYDYEILEFDGKEFKTPTFYNDLYPYYISDILVTNNGDIWFAGFQALIRVRDGNVTVFDPPEDNYWQTQLNALYEDSRGVLWVGTQGGIARFIEGEFEYYTQQEGMTGNAIYEIVEDNSGDLWIGTDKGITVFQGLNENGFPSEISEFETDGLYNQETVHLLFDQYGGLWQGTNAGLNYFNVQDWKTTGESENIHFPLSDYGYGVELNGWARVVDDEGRLWFGSATKGLIEYRFPENATRVLPDTPPQVYLREVLANNTPIYNQLSDDLLSKELEVSYDQNNISVSISGSDYKDPRRVSYRYKLEGFDNEWSIVPDIKEIKYTNLSAGDYSLMVTAKSTRSDWGAPTKLFSLTIQKPYWMTFWFYLLLLIGISGLIILYINNRVSKLEKKKLQYLVDEQTMDIQKALDEREVLIKEIHHRVKNNLAVVSGLLELQSWSLPDGYAKLAIQESKLRVMAMSKVHENLYQNEDLARVNFRRFLEDLIRNVSSTMKKPGQDVEIINYVDTVLIDVNIGIPIGLMVNEMVSNCYKHAFKNRREGSITIKFAEKDEHYQLILFDNGMGTEENLLELETQSLGLTLIKSLVSQLSAQIEYDGEEGARYKVQIPINQSV